MYVYADVNKYMYVYAECVCVCVCVRACVRACVCGVVCLGNRYVCACSREKSQRQIVIIPHSSERIYATTFVTWASIRTRPWGGGGGGGGLFFQVRRQRRQSRKSEKKGGKVLISMNIHTTPNSWGRGTFDIMSPLENSWGDMSLLLAPMFCDTFDKLILASIIYIIHERPQNS